MARPPTPANYEDLLVALFAAHERRDQSTVDRILADNPAHAAAMRTAIDRMQRAGLFDVDRDAFPYPDRLGDFRLLQPIGYGGMGIVFLAEQESLRRKVAVKLVRPELMLSEVARERFQREVETIARLQHPGIVPVLAVGQHRGMPYFVMEYVSGCSLAEVLLSVASRRPQDLDAVDFARAVGAPHEGHAARRHEGWWQAAVATIASVAETAAFVHERGILHRDLKPSNIMVTAEGHALLLDFGLAHGGPGHELTRTGTELGSLAYMSPEQVRGEALDERTDVYSLGVTLHQLLALELPFPTDSDAALRTAILQGNRRSLRDRNRGLPKDLFLCVQTATDFDRARRYGSMTDFASDLRAVLAGWPIRARPVGYGVRMQRWRRRHPFTAGAVAVSIAILLCLPMLVVWMQQRQNVQLREARAVAEADFGQARSAVDTLWRLTSELADLRDPAADELRRRMLDETLAFYAQLDRQHPGDASIVRTLAAVHRSAAILGWQTGRFAEAEQHLAGARRALALDPDPEHPDALLGLAMLCKVAARVAMEQDQWDSADTALDQMTAALKQLTASDPSHVEARLQLADGLNTSATVRGNQGRHAEKLELLRESLDAKRDLALLVQDTRVRISLAMQCNNLADTLADRPGDTTEAIELYHEAAALLDALDAPTDGASDVRMLRGEVRCGLGLAELALGRHEDAAQAFEVALTLQRDLCRQRPRELSHYYNLARTCCGMAELGLATGMRDRAEAAADEAESTASAGLERMPENKHLAELRRTSQRLAARARSAAATTTPEAAVPVDAADQRNR